MRKKISVLLIIVGITLIVLTVFQYYKVNNVYTKLRSNVVNEETMKKSNDKREKVIDWNKLKAINENIVAWLYIPGTGVDYPVIKATDNSFYLNHDIYGKSSIYGSIYLDQRYYQMKDINEADNIIIYGHNMNSGAMFGNLDLYADETYYQEHPFAYLQTEDSIQEYRIVTVLKADRNLFPFQQKLADAEAVQEYLKEAKQREVFETGDDYLKCIYDKVLTLVTCSYEWSGARNIVLAVPVSGAVWSQKCS